MDIAHLTPEELDYELKIRGVFGISTSRQKVNALREILNREGKGLEIPPKMSSNIIPPIEEILACEKIYGNILELLNGAWYNSDCLAINTAASRLHHLQVRLERICPNNSSEQKNVLEILDLVYDAIYKLENTRKPQSENGSK